MPAQAQAFDRVQRRADCQVARRVHDKQALRLVRRTRLIESRLKLEVNRENSAVDGAPTRTLLELGFQRSLSPASMP
jgi:hypothetical protein